MPAANQRLQMMDSVNAAALQISCRRYESAGRGIEYSIDCKLKATLICHACIPEDLLRWRENDFLTQ